MKTIIKAATELARAISYLHQSNIIHSDLSGSSIFLCTDPDGQGITLKVGALSAVLACSRWLRGAHMLAGNASHSCGATWACSS